MCGLCCRTDRFRRRLWQVRRIAATDDRRLPRRDAAQDHTGFANWDAWLDVAGVRNVATGRGLRINNCAAVLQAAIDGRGIALGRGIMARDNLKSGRLVRLFPKTTLASELAYYVVYRSESASLLKLVAFRDWLFEEALSG